MTFEKDILQILVLLLVPLMTENSPPFFQWTIPNIQAV